MSTPKETGERSEGLILAALLQAGKVVCLPFGDNQRYDLVIDEGDRFVRVQCKTGRVVKDVVVFHSCSLHYHRDKGSRSYRGQADLFGVYVPDLHKVYLVPVADVAVSNGALRLSPPKNNQTKGVRYAATYELVPP